MSELEKAFEEYLKSQLGDQQSVEIKVKDLRNNLAPQFISEKQPLSLLYLMISRMVSRYRMSGNFLRRSSGVYIYSPSGYFNNEVDQLESELVYRNVELRGIADNFDYPSIYRNQLPETITDLINSQNFLIVHDLASIDLRSLDGLSF